jgi:site-specific recombinase XerD
MSDGEPSPADAVDRFMARRETDATDRTIHSYESRLSHFVEWCEERGIDDVADLTPRHVDDYSLNRRRQGYEPVTVQGHLATLQVLLKYLDRVGFVEQDVAEAVDVPNLSAEEQSSDVRLAPADARPLLRYFRDSTAYYGTANHAALEVMWHTGARAGSIIGLDMEDYHPDERYLAFRHRPTTDTPLKNKHAGERLVGLSETVVDVLDTYVARERFDKRDEGGRRPLFSARQGRPSFSTLRAWAYQATQPCHYAECPHGKDRPTCKFTKRTHASKCPSSRSPHQIRTGSITWQLNEGLSVEQVSERVNASPDVIRRYYDKAREKEAFEQRRRAASESLDIDGDNHE